MARVLLRLSNASAAERAVLLAGLAFGSGLLSGFFDGPFNFGFPGAPSLPGLYFAIVLGVAIWLWGTRNAIETVAIIILTTLAWIAACRATLSIHDSILATLTTIANGTRPPTPNYVLAFCGALGGFVGGALTAASVSLNEKKFRTIDNWARIVLAGAAAGTLLECLAPQSGTRLPIHIGSLYPLFCVWQPVIAACVGYGLAPRSKSEFAAASPRSTADTLKGPALASGYYGGTEAADGIALSS